MTKEKTTNEGTGISKVPEHNPHHKKEEPTKPNRQIPEKVPRREQEEQNFPPLIVPEHKPHRTRIKPTKLKP